MLLSRDFKRLGDLAAGTIVVYASPPKPAAKLPQAQPTPPRWWQLIFGGAPCADGGGTAAREQTLESDLSQQLGEASTVPDTQSLTSDPEPRNWLPAPCAEPDYLCGYVKSPGPPRAWRCRPGGSKETTSNFELEDNTGLI